MFQSIRRMIREPLLRSKRKKRCIQKHPTDLEAPRSKPKVLAADALHGMLSRQTGERVHLIQERLADQRQVFAHTIKGDEEFEDAALGCCQAEIEELVDELEDDVESEPDEDLQQDLKALLRSHTADVDAMRGNMYRYWAFGQRKSSLSAIVGQVCVLLIQVIGPGAILVWNFYEMRLWTHHTYSFGTGHLVYQNGSDELGVSNLTRNVLTFLFLLGFLLNAIQANYQEAKDWQKCTLLFNVLRNKSLCKHIKLDMTGACPIWFVLGPIINCQALVICCIDTWLLMYTSVGSVSDVVMNVLAIYFLVKMDDLGSDLDFFDEDDWDPALMGQLYSEYCDKPKLLNLPLYLYFGMQGLTVKERTDGIPHHAALGTQRKVRKYRKYPHPVYAITALILWVMVFVLPFAFLFVEGFTQAAKDAELDEFQEQLNEIQQKLSGHINDAAVHINDALGR